MMIKPNYEDERIIACLHAEYRLKIAQIAFLPLGGDLSNAVYRVIEDDQTPYFCKLKSGVFDGISVELPAFLSEQGIAQIIAPLATKSGQLQVALDEYTLIIYPLIEGTNGYDVELT